MYNTKKSTTVNRLMIDFGILFPTVQSFTPPPPCKASSSDPDKSGRSKEKSLDQSSRAFDAS